MEAEQDQAERQHSIPSFHPSFHASLRHHHLLAVSSCGSSLGSFILFAILCYIHTGFDEVVKPRMGKDHQEEDRNEKQREEERLFFSRKEGEDVLF